MIILICFGTRPEYIKLKSIIDGLTNNEKIKSKLLFTGQHVDLLKHVNVDYNIDIKNESNNRLNDIWISIMKNCHIFDDVTHVMVQGDTSSAVAIAMSAFHHKKQIIYIESGLRTHNIDEPYPEELNRQLIARISHIHFCPTEYNKSNLLKENITNNIYVVGNTGLDNLDNSNIEYKDVVLVTLHRRDNYDNIDEWFMALTNIAQIYDTIKFVFPMHPSPNIRNYKHLLKRITILEPLSREETINILKICKFVISDSGGLQEEASYFNKKIIICRKYTERLEIIGSSGVLCVEPSTLLTCVETVNNDYKLTNKSPYIDNEPAYKRIINVLETFHL